MRKLPNTPLAENIKITVHAAESNDEEEFFQTGAGFFAELYRKTNLEWNAPRTSPVEYLANIGVLRAKPLLAHCVKVSDRDIELIAASDSRIAHCPKSNAKFGHGIAPLEKFLDAKIRVGFGSDSVASNNTCDILEEARFATHCLPETTKSTKRFLSAEETIKTATRGAARALGLDSEIGTLEAGKQADIIVISLADIAQQPVHDVYSALLYASNARDVLNDDGGGRRNLCAAKQRKLTKQEIKAKMREIREKMRQ
ncbi:MAG: amidohydrolase family protein [Pyrinomonadaceae bacterium]